MVMVKVNVMMMMENEEEEEKEEEDANNDDEQSERQRGVSSGLSRGPLRDCVGVLVCLWRKLGSSVLGPFRESF